ncbi:MAG: polysaccharide biosynthesis/export family protein [Thermodesulfobacteriota bacterium]|nr:polysaccharide biosynthesis/export family protein [Thermodesulfobacteriota bacterium]
MKNRVFLKIGFVCLLFSICIVSITKAGNTKISGINRPYILGSEDVIEVLVWKEDAFSRVVIVRPDGKISLPVIGDVQAAGLTTDELTEKITEKLKGFIDNPTVSVIVTQINSMKVYIQGEVERPGVYQLKSNTTVLQAISLAGGFSEWAKKDKIVIVRDLNGKGTRIPVNYKNIIWGKDISQSLILERGDTIIVP